MKDFYKKLLPFLLFTFCAIAIYAESPEFIDSLSSESYVQWEEGVFLSKIELDVNKANITLPSGRSVATKRIEQNLLSLVKNPLMTVTVNSSTKITDAITRGNISIATIAEIIANSKKTPTAFSKDGTSMSTIHTITMQNLVKTFIKHNNTYKPNIPIDRVSTKPYTGIIIDARGLLPVKGEFSEKAVEPALFPRVWDAEMNLLYEVNMVEPEIVLNAGMVSYAHLPSDKMVEQRVGDDPLTIIARGVYGIHKTDPIISKNDALKILSIPENVELLAQGKVVILLDKGSLTYAVKASTKDDNYYFAMEEVSDHIFETEIKDLEIHDTEKGMLIPLRDLKFISDSAELLPEETNRLDVLAEALILATEGTDSSILIEGHTASVGKPEGEKQLSIERAQKIVSELEKRGLATDLFTVNGYGGEIPIGDNSTDAGRASNRRVEITVVPKQTYIQRIQ